MTLFPEMVRVAILGGALALDRAAGWNLMLSQPLVGACMAGALVNPGPEWELWALRVPIGVGALLQLLLTDSSLPAAQRRHDTGSAGVIGSTVALLGMVRLHGVIPTALGGALWVLVGVAAGLLAAVVGGRVMDYHRARSRDDVARADVLAERGAGGAFDILYWRAVARIFALGAAWAWAGSLIGLTLAILLLPRAASYLTGRRIGFLFATILGAALAAGYDAHVRGRRGGARWMALGAAVALVVLTVAGRTAP